MLLFYVLFLVQVVSESFPISSSGHVLLLESLIAYYSNSAFFNDTRTFFMSDEVMHMLHIPTLCIIMFFFRQRWIPVLLHPRKTWRIVIRMVSYIIGADVITSIFYVVKKQNIYSFPLYMGFCITLLFLISLLFVSSDQPKKVTFSTLAILGVVQGMALLLPGVSRFASVYVVARWLGIMPDKAFAITWMIQWPLILAAAVASLRHAQVLYLLMSGQVWLVMVLGGIMALGGMYIVYWMAVREKLWLFSIYMILPVVVSWIFCL